MRLPEFDRSRFPVRRLVICALASLLIFYHVYTLIDLYFGSGTDLYGPESGGVHAGFVHLQSMLRVGIVLSLAFVILNRRLGLVGMWFAIPALIATHYWAVFFDLSFRFLDGRHPISYLKGLIIPTVITLLYLSMNSRRKGSG